MTKSPDAPVNDIASDLASLREDVSRLTRSLSDILRVQSSITSSSVLNVMDDARDQLSRSATDAQSKLLSAGADLEKTIERNPVGAVMVAAVIGLAMGIVSRTRR